MTKYNKNKPNPDKAANKAAKKVAKALALGEDESSQSEEPRELHSPTNNNQKLELENAMSASPATWRRFETPEGRPYYFDATTNQTVWNRPDGYQAWKEHTHNDGRKYYHNEETKETKWDMPAEMRSSLLGQSSLPPRPVAAAPVYVASSAPPPTYVAGGIPYPEPRDNARPRSRDRDRPRSRDRDDYPRERYDRLSMYPRDNGPFGSQPEQEYASIEEAEAALFKLFKRVGAQVDWTWETTMKATIKDPQFRAVKDPKDRKVAFEKYVIELRVQEKEKERDRLTKLRSDFSNMLRSHPEIKHYSRWKTVQPIISGETVYRSAKSDEERKQLFEEYIVELNKANKEREISNRSAALEQMANDLSTLDLEPYTRWKEAKEIITSAEKYQNDEKFKALTKVDVLKTFENHIKSLERKFNDAVQKDKNLRQRKYRVNRDRFIELLESLRNQGKIHAESRWMDIHEEIRDDSRYKAMLGQPGSTPLDLFWDVLQKEEESLKDAKHDVDSALGNFQITSRTTLEEYMNIVRRDRKTSGMDQDTLKIIFKRLQEKSRKRDEDDRHHADRHQRKAIENLRSRIKRLEPHVILDDTWEQVRPRLEKYEEYNALDSEDLRRSAFDKHVARLKEKSEEDRVRRDRDRSRRNDRERDRERPSGRDRDHRNGHRHRSRTPEADAYEADRRKAQADRERQYRKSSLGLSPPHRGRDRDERDKFDRRSVTQSHYERERREREAERERTYVSRADPRERSTDLDYGDSRPGSVRRRRDSDTGSLGSRRDTKRSKRDRRSPSSRKTKSPLPEPVPKEDPGLRSGSEEGEIEED